MHRKLITLPATLATRRIPANVSLASKTVRAVVSEIEAVTIGRRRELTGKATIKGRVYAVRAGGFGEVWRVETSAGDKTK